MIIDKIVNIINTNEYYKDFELVHSNLDEVRVLYEGYIIIIKYHDDKILNVNGIKTYPKFIMDKFEHDVNPQSYNHYRHHESHHHCEDHKQTCKPEYMYNSDVMRPVNPPFSVLHASLDDYKKYILKDIEAVNKVICFIECVIAVREGKECDKDCAGDIMKETDPIWMAEKVNYYNKEQIEEKLKAIAQLISDKVDYNIFDDSQKVQNTRLDKLEDKSINPDDYYTKVQIDEQQSAQDTIITKNTDRLDKVDEQITDHETRIKKLEDGGVDKETDPIWTKEKVDYMTKKEIEEVTGQLAIEIGSAQGDITLLKKRVVPTAIAFTNPLQVTTVTENLVYASSSTSNSDNLTFSDDQIINSDTSDKTNYTIIQGVLIIKAKASFTSGYITIQCPQTDNHITQTLVLEVTNSAVVPFAFNVDGEYDQITIAVSCGQDDILEAYPSPLVITKMK